MKKFLKWTGISLLILLVLVIALPFMFKGKLIQLAKDEANKSLNAKVDFGEFDLTIFSSFPDFRFSINNVSVVGVGDFEKDTLAYLKKLQLDVNVMSVINGDKIKVKEIILTEPKVNAIVLHDGKANWDITKPSADTTTTAPDTAKTKFKLSLKKFKITKAQISYNDMQGNTKASLADFDFMLKGDFTQDNFLMGIITEIQKMNFSTGGVSYAKDMHVKMKIDLDADMPNMKFTFKENEFNFNELGLGLDGFVAMPDSNINMDIKFLCKQTEFKNILSLIPAVYSKDFASVQTAGKLALNGYAKGTYNSSSLPAFGTHLEISNAMFKYPSLPKSVNNINIKVDVENPNGKPDATAIDVEKFHVEMAGNPLDMVMHVRTPVSDPNLQGEIKGKVDLSSVKEFVPLDKTDDMSGVVTADVKIKGKMSSITNKKYDEFNAQGTIEVDKILYKTASLPYDIMINMMKLNFTPQYVELSSFDSKMGNSDIKANGKIENFMQYIFQDSLIKGNFALNSSLMDLNQLMGSSSTTAATPAAADTTPMSLVEVPANIDFVLNSNIGKLLYDKLEITGVVGEIIVRNARAAMTNLKMNLLDGSMIMNGFYDTKNKRKPNINFNLNINEFDIQKTNTAFNTVKKIAPITNSSRGKFSTTLNDFTAILKQDMSPDMNTLNGRGTLKTKSVSIDDFPPFVKLDDELHLNKLKKVAITDVMAEYEFKDSRVYTKPFKTKVAEIPVEISGSTGFDQTLDYKWNMDVPTKMMGSQGQEMAQGWLNQAAAAAGTKATLPEKVNVTALIGGTVTKPVIKTGLKDAMKDIKNDVKNQVKEVIEQKKEEVIKDAKAEAAKQAEKILADAQKMADDVKAQGAKLADEIRKQGNVGADSVTNMAKGPLEKLAAKKVADGIRKQADNKAQKATDEANAKADKIMADARAQADKLKQ
ncbi:MAG: hypothetical protein ACXVC6_11625 [Bacteroidia bacterium]